jgi:hypothetical protein
MSKKVLVLSKELEGKNLNHIDFETVAKAYTVPAGLVDIASVMLPDIIGLGDLSLDIPKFDKKQNSMEICMHKKSDGEEKYILKLTVSFDEKKPHEFKVSTDGGETWKEVTYKGDSVGAAAPAEA